MNVLQGVAKKGLSPEEERELIVRLKNGDTVALQTLVNRFRLFVVGAVSRYAKRSDPLWDDLFQEGCLGLIHAAEKFDVSRGLRFSTYARWWVLYYVQTEFRGQGLSVRNRSRAMKRWWDRGRKAERNLRRKLGREPTNEEIAAELDVRPDSLAEARHYYLHKDKDIADCLSLEALGPDVDDVLDIARVSRQLYRAMGEVLAPRERQVIDRYYLQGKSLRETGQLSGGVSGERARQIRDRALEKLRAALGVSDEPP